VRTIAGDWKFSLDYYKTSLSTLNTALEQVPVYKPWQALDPGRDYSIDIRYACMPAFTKRDIRDNFPSGMLPSDRSINQGLENKEISLVETSGTTDDKVTNIWNQKWWDASEKSSWKLNSHINKIATGDHREAILVNPRNVGFISDNIDLPIEKRRLSRYLYLNEKTDPIKWTPELMNRMIGELNVFQPAVLEANPSYLARLCRHIAVKKKIVFQPGIITFTYEYPTSLHYRQIRRVFDVPMASSYGTTETGYVFMQCEKGKFHQNTDFCRVDFQPFKPEHGGPLRGRILVTPFNNPWNHMLRFDVGDLVRLEASGRCACGRDSGLILSSIEGRKTNITLTCHDRPVTLHELDTALNILEDIDEYKLVQVNPNSYELHLVSQRTDKSKLSATSKEILQELYGKEANVSVIYETAIPPENSGKYQLSKNLFPVDLEKYLDERYLPPKL
jgi:phenylacetate-coenzyme A ligase PaaK-like adenylate-forming protein